MPKKKAKAVDRPTFGDEFYRGWKVKGGWNIAYLAADNRAYSAFAKTQKEAKRLAETLRRCVGQIYYLKVLGMRILVEINGFSPKGDKVEVIPVAGDRSRAWVDATLLSKVGITDDYSA